MRAYERFSDHDNPSRWASQQPVKYEQFAESGRLLDLVLLFQSARGDVAGFLDFAEKVVKRHAFRLYSVHVTEEASFRNGPDVIDGSYPNVLRALVEGVVRVKATLQQMGQHQVLVGFNATPTFGPSSTFWSEIRSMSSILTCHAGYT